MNRNGFSLVELIITIALISIMLGLATFQFTQFSRKSQVENQTRKFYGDLMELRSQAMFEKRNRGVKLSTSTYSIYSSEVMTVAPEQVITLKAPIKWNNSADIIFDTRGMLKDEPVDAGSICVVEKNDAPVDSIVVSMTRIKLGKLKEGMDCKSDNIISK